MDPSMPCPRCHGLVVESLIVSASAVLPGFSCVNCGEYVDQATLQNRRLSRRPDRQARVPIYDPERILAWRFRASLD